MVEKEPYATTASAAPIARRWDNVQLKIDCSYHGANVVDAHPNVGIKIANCDRIKTYHSSSDARYVLRFIAIRNVHGKVLDVVPIDVAIHCFTYHLINILCLFSEVADLIL